MQFLGFLGFTFCLTIMSGIIFFQVILPYFNSEKHLSEKKRSTDLLKKKLGQDGWDERMRKKERNSNWITMLIIDPSVWVFYGFVLFPLFIYLWVTLGS